MSEGASLRYDFVGSFENPSRPVGTRAQIANSNGAILKMLDEKNPVVYTNGGRRYKMFQYLSDVVGPRAFRAHLWKTIGIGRAAKTKEGFDRAFITAFSGGRNAGRTVRRFD